MHRGWPDEFPNEDELWPLRPPVHPDDRLWRHPSELAPAPPTPARRRRRLWPLAMASGVVGALASVGLLAGLGLLDRPEPASPGVVRQMVRPARVRVDTTMADDDVVRIAAETRPAIVRIEVDGDQPGSGSGVLIRDDGYLVTNAHVVEGAETITVVLADGTERDGDLVGADELTDVAVVRVSGDEPFPTAVLGSAASLAVGQPAIAIGSPLGLAGGSSVTTGVVSALGREVRSDDGAPLLDMIQTDAAISPGSSGGALLDTNGAVIGITTAIAVSEVGAEGLGFATPVDIAQSVATDIIETGRAVHVWLGVRGTDLDADSAGRAGVDGGAMVDEVVAGAPADEAGLTARDVIVGVEDQPVSTMTALVIALRDRRPGDVVTLDVLRNGTRSEVDIVLEERSGD